MRKCKPLVSYLVLFGWLGRYFLAPRRQGQSVSDLLRRLGLVASPPPLLMLWLDMPSGAIFCTLGLPIASLGRPTRLALGKPWADQQGLLFASQECNRWRQGACLARALGQSQEIASLPRPQSRTDQLPWSERLLPQNCDLLRQGQPYF